MAKGTRLISLNFKPSEELPSLADFNAYLGTDFGHRVPGFAVLEHEAKWGDSVLELVGRAADGALVAVFPSVSVHERDLHAVLANAMIATSWFEDNRDEAERLYAGRGVDLDRPLRMILVVPSIANPSRSMRRALERAGLEIMPYAIYDLATPDGVLTAVSFEMGGAPAPPAPSREVLRREPVVSRTTESPDPHTAIETPRVTEPPSRIVEPPSTTAPLPEPEPIRAEPAQQAEPASRIESASEASPARPASPIETFVLSISDAKLKGMADQIVAFFHGRFPTATAVVNEQSGFTLRLGKEHLVTVRLDRSSVWLEVGPERIPTSKIKDPTTLERAMALPSVLEALHSVRV